MRSTRALRIVLCLMALGVARHAAADTITVEWDPATEPVGYKVHVGVTPGTYTQHFDVGSVTLFNYTNATAGQRYCFTVSAYLLSSQLEGPISSEVCGYSNAPPTLVNPGSRNSTVGVAITALQLQGSDPDSQPLTYSAIGLPPGLSVQASTGYISGTGTTAGNYSVTARASDGVLTASQTFTWTMTAPAPTPDTTLPTISITSPTSSGTHSTTSTSINLTGTANDNVGVTGVTWATGGSSSPATGTTSWSANAIPLIVGQNVITVTARDAAGNYSNATLTVTRSTTTADSTLPTVSIATPTTGATFSTSSTTINLTGTANDNVGVTQVSWANDRGGSGVGSGAASWAIGSIPLQTGTNIITVIGLDAAGNAGSDTLTVYFQPTTPSASVTLTAQRGTRNVSLSWRGASWSHVSIYRNGAKIKEMRNNGSASDNPPKGGGTFDYKVCAAGSTTTCSNTATVIF